VKVGTTIDVWGPFVGLIAALYLLVTWQANPLELGFDLLFTAVYYVATALGVTVGYHRLLTHESFETKQWVKDVLVGLGITGLQGSPFMWAADHRLHHMHTDEEGDPHSPHKPHGGWRGLFHAHMGWLFGFWKKSRSDLIPDLIADSHLRTLNALFVPIALFSWIVFPLLVGLAVKQSLIGGVQTMLWAGFARAFLVQHVTWSINSICHKFGERPYGIDPQTGMSTNVHWRVLLLLSFGETRHHNHHAFPNSAIHGFRSKEEFRGDRAGRFILWLEKHGLASNIGTVTPEDEVKRQEGIERLKPRTPQPAAS
jgi:stearoyl-CoA desaturase (delta-9 desaturase)